MTLKLLYSPLNQAKMLFSFYKSNSDCFEKTFIIIISKRVYVVTKHFQFFRKLLQLNDIIYALKACRTIN